MLELIFVNIPKRPCKLLIYMNRESDFQSVGREFESRRTHQRTQGPVAIRGLFLCYRRSSKSGVQAAFFLAVVRVFLLTNATALFSVFVARWLYRFVLTADLCPSTPPTVYRSTPALIISLAVSAVPQVMQPGMTAAGRSSASLERFAHRPLCGRGGASCAPDSRPAGQGSASGPLLRSTLPTSWR